MMDGKNKHVDVLSGVLNNMRTTSFAPPDAGTDINTVPGRVISGNTPISVELETGLVLVFEMDTDVAVVFDVGVDGLQTGLSLSLLLRRIILPDGRVIYDDEELP